MLQTLHMRLFCMESKINTLKHPREKWLRIQMTKILNIMKTKKMLILVGVLFGLTASICPLILAQGWGWIPIELVDEFTQRCTSIQNAEFVISDYGNPEGIESVYGTCRCMDGFVPNEDFTACIPFEE